MPDEIAEDRCEDAIIGRAEAAQRDLKHLALLDAPSTELKPEFRGDPENRFGVEKISGLHWEVKPVRARSIMKASNALHLSNSQVCL